jgi:hypothetical protein
MTEHVIPNSQFVIDLKAPTAWEDLSAEQTLYIGKLYASNKSRYEMLALAFLKFAGLRAMSGSQLQRVRSFRHFWKPEKFNIKPETFREFCERLAFITDDIGIMTPPSFKNFDAPDRQLFNISLDRYLNADFLYQYVNQQNKITQMTELVKTVYTPKSKRATKKLKLDNAQATAVYLWYTGVKKWLRNEYPMIFTDAEGDRIQPREAVLNLLSIFNEGKPQNNKLILETSMHEIMFELNKMCRKNYKL